MTEGDGKSFIWLFSSRLSMFFNILEPYGKSRKLTKKCGGAGVEGDGEKNLRWGVIFSTSSGTRGWVLVIWNPLLI